MPQSRSHSQVSVFRCVFSLVSLSFLLPLFTPTPPHTHFFLPLSFFLSGIAEEEKVVMRSTLLLCLEEPVHQVMEGSVL